MNNEFERFQWSQHLNEKKDSESNNITLTPDLLCNKSLALTSYINNDPLAADFKWSLFCAACNSYRFDSVLKPFPPFFLLQDGTKQIERLREIIELCPSVSNILKQLKNNTLPSALKDLLFWVLVHLCEPNLKYIAKDEHQAVISQVPSGMPATMPDFIFSVTYSTKHQQKFADTALNYLTKYAFHGSRLDNFYSIVNYGLQVSFNKIAAFGPGIYLSKEMVVSLSYSPRGFTWASSIFGSHISVVALCEIIDHPSIRSEIGTKKNSIFESKDIQSTSGKYLIVENSDLIQIRYLLVYSSDDFESSSLVQSSSLFGWIKRHKMFAFIIAYIIFLLGIGSSNSSLLYKHYKKLLRRFDNSGSGSAERQW